MMPRPILNSTIRRIACFSLLFVFHGMASNLSAAEPFDVALQTLQRASEGTQSQVQLREAWNVVASGGADQLTVILAAMSDVGPVAENWLRAAVDTIGERELQTADKLPADDLEKFVLDPKQSPRARRTAFEWLTQVDPKAPERLLPKMLDDASLELRHDAVARLIAEVEATSGDAEKLLKVRRALRSARSFKQMKSCIGLLEDLGEKPKLSECFGFLTDWKAIGPFDNTDGSGFDKVFPPETKIDFTKQVEGKHGLVGWQELSAEEQDLKKVGELDLNKALDEEKAVLGYVVAKFVLAEAQTLECRFETVNGVKLWVNGELLLSKDLYHSGSEFDQYAASAKFRRGENTILLKVCQNAQTEIWARPWGVRLRVTDELGGAVAQAVGEVN